jgi:hypothetical protein
MSRSTSGSKMIVAPTTESAPSTVSTPSVSVNVAPSKLAGSIGSLNATTTFAAGEAFASASAGTVSTTTGRSSSSNTPVVKVHVKSSARWLPARSVALS